MFDTARHSQLVDEVFALAPVIPVLAIDRIEDALPLCRALVDNGLPVLEITLRTACALDAIALVARALPHACVGAGTVLSEADLAKVTEAGARFAISPGATDTLFNAAKTSAVPLIPGIA
ncbi:MAG: keto-deoxy-phosphogluconate aldolase, partial [Comamonadaceae bacterium]